MPDISHDAIGVKKKMHDNGDGTFSEVVYELGSGGVNHDYVAFTYDGSGNLLTATYKTGGSSGTVVKTVTNTYDGSGNLLTSTIS